MKTVECECCKLENDAELYRTCRSCDRHLTHHGLQSAFDKGYDAQREGKSWWDCPYEDKRTGKYGHRVTFSRAYLKAWRRGYEWSFAEEARIEHVLADHL